MTLTPFVLAYRTQDSGHYRQVRTEFKPLVAELLSCPRSVGARRTGGRGLWGGHGAIRLERTPWGAGTGLGQEVGVRTGHWDHFWCTFVPSTSSMKV